MAKKLFKQIPVVDSAGRLVMDKLGATLRNVSESTGLVKRKQEGICTKMVRWAPGKSTLTKTAFIIFAVAATAVIVSRLLKVFMHDHD